MDVEGHWRESGILASPYPFLGNSEVSGFVLSWTPTHGDSTGPDGNELKFLRLSRNKSSTSSIDLSQAFCCSSGKVAHTARRQNDLPIML